MKGLAFLSSVAVANGQATSLAPSGDMKVLGGSVVGGSCEYANEVDGGFKSPAATSPHIATGRYCGVNAKMFAAGAGCGDCYNVSYSGEGGTNPGSAGWEVVQVVNSADIDFACNKDVFRSITGANTGVFPITYQKIACEVDSAVGVATVLDGKNAYYTKAIFSDLPHAVSSAKLKIGEKSFPMDRVAGATFMANTDGSTASASFELTLADGSISKLAPCFESWPVATDSSCAPKAFDGVEFQASNQPLDMALNLNMTTADHSACLAAVQKFRPDITLCNNKYSAMADTQAAYDSSHGPHAYVKSKGWTGTCAGMSSGQCECPGWGSEQQSKCVTAYHNEGPGSGDAHGHYRIMMNSASKCVACGYSGGTMTHNFCGSDSKLSEQVIV